jgi:hypothetical protein
MFNSLIFQLISNNLDKIVYYGQMKIRTNVCQSHIRLLCFASFFPIPNT